VARWNALWLTLAFLSEVAALAVLAAWGWSAGSGAARWLPAVGLPLLAAVLWGVFAAPRAPVRVHASTVAVQVLVLGGAVLALVDLGHPWWAGVLAVAALLGTVVARPPVFTAPAGL
jgi:hypothetical protein